MKNISNLYPVQAVEFKEKDGLVVLLKKNHKPNIIEKLFFKKHLDKPFKIDLDKIGTFVWHLCDGKHSVADITGKMISDFEEDVKSADARVTMFVHQLNKNGLINLFEKREKN